MPTVKDLAAQQYQEIAYLFVVEGWPIAWTNRVELTGAGKGSWIGTDYGERTVVLGLEPPSSVRLAVGIVDTGMLIDDDLTVTLVDRDDHLIAYNTDEVGVAVYRYLSPKETAPTDVIGEGGNSYTLRGKWINGESIGINGERRQYQILPDGGLPGYEHASITDQDSQTYLRPSLLQQGPRFWEGLPCALYVIRRDPTTGQWPSWSEQYASGYSLLWWGSVRNLSAQSHQWHFECEGPSSWLRKTLNINAPAEWQKFDTLLDLAPGEDLFAVALSYRSAQGDATELCGNSAYTPDDKITDFMSHHTVRQDIAGRISTLIGVAGPAGHVFSAVAAGVVQFPEEHFLIRCESNNAGNPNGYPLGASCQLRMHKKVWVYLGWDLALQGKSGVIPLEDQQEVHASTDEETTVFNPGPGGSSTADPASGMWEATFDTLPLGEIWAFNEEFVYADNDGSARLYYPRNQAGVSLLYPEGGQTVHLGIVPPYLPGQLMFPPADKTITSGTCNSAGFIALRGSYKASAEADVETKYQLARVSWYGYDDKLVAQDSNLRSPAWLEQWLYPPSWGAKDKPIGGPWASNDLEYVPVAILASPLDKSPGRAHQVLLRLLLSTGTAKWEEGVFTVGDNEHQDGVDALGNDREIADLGLGIPRSLINYKSFLTAADALPQGRNGSLNHTRLAFIGPFDSQELIQNLLTPRGWCFSLRGGQYGLFARSVPLDITSVEVEITQSDIAGEPDELPPSETGDFRPLEPIDIIEVEWNHDQLSDSGETKTFQVRARDPRAHRRRSNARMDIDGRTLIANPAWHDEFRELWGNDMARYYAEPWAMVTVQVKGDKAKDLWPGTIVSYTSPWPATRNGAYGMVQRVGRVISVERDLSTLAATVEMLVAGRDPTLDRRYAPMARLVDNHTTVEGRHNSATKTITCYANAWGRSSSVRDVAAFAEPAWSQVGGDAVAQVWMSWDGKTWEKTATLVIDSVDTSTNTITYSSMLPGDKIWENRFGVVVMAPYDEQNDGAWPRSVFGVLCDSDGKFGGTNLAGFPWVE